MDELFEHLATTREAREELYVWFHQHPELSMQEVQTRARISKELMRMGLEPQECGGGVVAVVRNGEGPTVLVRADFDALPMAEESGKTYAADPELGRMHSCGHDVHTTALLGATETLATCTDAWSGTFIALFQPGEEIAAGAQSMLDDGLADLIPTPDVALAQHVLTGLPGGCVGGVPGPFLSTAKNITVRIQGKGGHGSMPHLAVDPVVIASSTVMRLQTIVARELAPGTFGVVTVGSVQAGTSANIIPDSATLQINIRAFDESVAQHLTESIERIARSEAAAAGAPEPTFEYSNFYPLTDNDPQAAGKVMDAFRATFGEQAVPFEGAQASEDFSVIPRALGVPYFYWGLGGFAAPENAPGNHNPAFAPDMQPTLDRGSEAILAAAGAWLIP
ncbi:amidohydrolase [Corynebacterium renale]|uniref:Hippurate hydrolase n=1 Tax=Corynebacterium renale TaxID=1724 RepID=A0A2A9DMV9_9CORY|nr:amidohydrolase [Corynebacterium renale]PFG27944.1 hippurate hydrolase [Corynebacterium renale]SQI21645.1 peptidase [Corynebacterium renale]